MRSDTKLAKFQELREKQNSTKEISFTLLEYWSSSFIYNAECSMALIQASVHISASMDNYSKAYEIQNQSNTGNPKLE